MNKNRLFIIITVVIILLGVSLIGWFTMKPAATILQGQVEATEVKVATKLVGRVEKLLVQEGDKVVAGQQLLLLDSPEVHAKMEQAQAARSAALAQKNKADNGARIEQIQGAQNMWLKAQAGADLAAKTYERVLNLYNDGVVPMQKRDEAETQLKAAELTAKAAKANYEMAKKGARSEDIDAAGAMVLRADGAIAEVNAYLNETTLSAPIAGEVSNIIPAQGELVSPGFPVITLVDLTDAWVTFNIREDYLVKLHMGDEITVDIPALGKNDVKMKINYINPLGEYATWRATKSTGDFDMKTFEVRAIPTAAIKGLRPGMSALFNWSRYQPANR